MAKIRVHLFFRVSSELSIGSEQTSKARDTFLICAYYTTKGTVVAIHPDQIHGSVSTCSIRFSSVFRTEPFLTHHKQKNSPSSTSEDNKNRGKALTMSRRENRFVVLGGRTHAYRIADFLYIAGFFCYNKQRRNPLFCLLAERRLPHSRKVRIGGVCKALAGNPSRRGCYISLRASSRLSVSWALSQVSLPLCYICAISTEERSEPSAWDRRLVR